MVKRNPPNWISSIYRETGSNLVEFALVAPVLLLVVFGICQYGFMYSASMTIKNATVEAARFATSTTSSPSIDQITTVAEDALAPTITVTNNNVSVIVNQDVTVGVVGGATSVEIDYTMPLIIPWIVPGANGQITLHAITIMK